MDGPALSIRISPSRRLFAVLTTLHGFAVLAPWTAELPLLLRLATSVVALLGLVRLGRAWRLESAGWKVAFHDGAWTLEADGREQFVEVLPDTVVWRHLVILRLRGTNGVRSLVLLEQSCGATALRRLRVVLRMQAPPG